MLTTELKLTVVVDQTYAENTYIAHLDGRRECLVFDPGLEPDRILAVLQDQGLTPTMILNTHGHSDHIAGNAALKDRWPDCPLVIGAGDAEKLTDPDKNLSAAFGVPFTSPPADLLVRESDHCSAAGFELHVLETPGHSPGHVVYVWKEHAPWVVFGGDVLFQGSVGRTDFIDGNFEQLATSVHEKLFTLPDDTFVLPGHGSSTTIADEKRSNPFVGRPAGYRG